jgi:hypothetical protein
LNTKYQSTTTYDAIVKATVGKIYEVSTVRCKNT